MNTIYQLTHPWGEEPLDDFATNDKELRCIAINHYRNCGLEVRAEIDWEAETVTAIPINGDIEARTYNIIKVNRATQEDEQ